MLESKSIGHGMEPKVFWGMTVCQGLPGKNLGALILMGAWCEIAKQLKMCSYP